MELLVVLAIIGLISGVVGVSVTRLVQQQRFRAGVGAVVNRLQMAQDLMLVHDTDAVVRFAAGDDGVVCTLQVEKPLSKGLNTVVNDPLRLQGITAVTFADYEGPFYRDDVRLDFLFGGSRMSAGRLVMRGVRGQEQFVDLVGYPRPIVEGRRLLLEKTRDESDELYPREILEAAPVPAA